MLVQPYYACHFVFVILFASFLISFDVALQSVILPHERNVLPLHVQMHINIGIPSQIFRYAVYSAIKQFKEVLRRDQHVDILFQVTCSEIWRRFLSTNPSQPLYDPL